MTSKAKQSSERPSPKEKFTISSQFSPALDMAALQLATL